MTRNLGDILAAFAEGLVYLGRGVRPLDVVVRVPPIVIDRLHRPELNRFSGIFESEYMLWLFFEKLTNAAFLLYLREISLVLQI